MKMFNTIIVWDVYAMAETPEAAREAAIMHIREGLKPSEQNALPVTAERNIRKAWLDERPLVGADVSDADFERCKGKSTVEIFRDVFTKETK